MYVLHASVTHLPHFCCAFPNIFAVSLSPLIDGKLPKAEATSVSWSTAASTGSSQKDLHFCQKEEKILSKFSFC